MNEGYVMVIGECVACQNRISFNPVYVPSLRVNGVKRELCKSCFDKWNQIHRTSQGLPLIPLHPEAYEPCPESEIG